MAFRPGQSGNPSGRPLGAKNRVSADLRDRIAGFLEDNFDAFVSSIASIRSPATRARFYLELLQFAVPKLRSVETPDLLDRLDDSEIEALYDGLMDRIETLIHNDSER